MTDKPTAKKYRIRRVAKAAKPAQSDAPPPTPQATSSQSEQGAGKKRDNSDLFAPIADDGFGDQKFPTAQANAQPMEPRQVEALAAIKAEGLSPRQLRMAGRLAQKHKLSPSNDYDAVRLLRDKGIDPFSRSNMLELVVPNQEGQNQPAPGKGQQVQLPQKIDTQPGTDVDFHDPAAGRARAIKDIQRDIAQRRRRKMALLAVRLLFFIAIPTACIGYYYYKMATPLYATHSEFVIQQADAAAPSAGGIGGLLGGGGLGSIQDSVTVQSYLTSREAMMRLDDEVGFRSHFAEPWIDPIKRLDPEATNEDVYKLYKSKIKIGYDPTEGIIRMEVVAADPDVSAEFSNRLIYYAEEQVDDLTQRLRTDQMAGATESLADAEAKWMAAQRKVEELQTQLGVLDPVAESSAILGQVSTLETQVIELTLSRDQLLAAPRPNQARLRGVEASISRLQEQIALLRSQLTQGSQNSQSMAEIGGKLRMAEVDLETRTLMMQQALQQQETARIEANRQTRYLSRGVNPIAPDEPTYPRAFENTAVAFAVFAGLYLLLSLTASVLREQLSS